MTRALAHTAERIYPVPVKEPSGITSWEGWPDDVRDTILGWNRGKGLSFNGSARDVFKCSDCERFCRQSCTANFRGVPICDDCLIARARSEVQG